MAIARSRTAGIANTMADALMDWTVIDIAALCVLAFGFLVALWMAEGGAHRFVRLINWMWFRVLRRG